MITEKIFNKITDDKLLLSLKNQKTLIYGAGNTGKDVYNILKKNNYPISGFIDNARFNTPIDNNAVYHIETIKKDFNRYQYATVIIAIFNRATDIAAIILQLKQIGFKTIFTFIDFYQYFENELKERFWLSNTRVLIDEQEKIEQARALFTDEKSKQLVENIINFRRSCDYTQLNEPLGLDQQYFPKDIPYWNDNPCFIDAGAYDGDTIRLATEKNIQFSSAICFEPNLTNYKKLVSSNSQIKETKFFQIPCGLWSETSVLRFDSSQGEGSNISANGEDIISVVALDDIALNYAPTHIKMDIEGAELAALEGAKNTIIQYQPNLAICVYHQPKDLWEIPLSIEKLNLGYKLYLRNYGFSIFDTVLYCVK